jgi:hypothetical protein
MNHEMEDKQVPSIARLLPFFAGGSIGALVGLCMGLSVSPVVATVLAALGTSLLALLGLKDSSADAAGRFQTYRNSLRVLGFGLFAILAVGAGLLIRTHGWLSPPLTVQKAILKDAGFNDRDIRRVLLGRELGSSMERASYDPVSKRDELKEAGFSDADTRAVLLYRELAFGSTQSSEAKTKPAESKSEPVSGPPVISSPISSVLFASSAEECQKLDPHQFADVDSFITSLKNRKGKYAKLAATLGNLNPSARVATAQAFYEFSCQ